LFKKKREKILGSREWGIGSGEWKKEKKEQEIREKMEKYWRSGKGKAYSS